MLILVSAGLNQNSISIYYSNLLPQINNTILKVQSRSKTRIYDEVYNPQHLPNGPPSQYIINAILMIQNVKAHIFQRKSVLKCRLLGSKYCYGGFKHQYYGNFYKNQENLGVIITISFSFNTKHVTFDIYLQIQYQDCQKEMASVKEQLKEQPVVGQAVKTYQWYQNLKKPSITPPVWVFPVAWSILYVMIAVSGYQYISKTGMKLTPATFFYFLQLVLNLIWSPLFFWKKMITVALVDLILLWISVLVTIILFHQTSPFAANLLIPYLGWLCVAGYLNAYVVVMNPEESEFKKKRL